MRSIRIRNHSVAQEHRRESKRRLDLIQVNAVAEPAQAPRKHAFEARFAKPLRVARGYSRVMKIIARWLLLAAALLLVAHLYPGVQVTSFTAALVAALVLGLFNALLRPLLVLLTLPVTIVTLGLFLFVINALMFYFAASVLDGFQVSGFVAALIGSLIYSLCGVVIDVALERLFKRG